MTRRNSSGRVSITGASLAAIALLTHTSMGPSSASICAAARSTCSGSATSAGATHARTPMLLHLAPRGLEPLGAAGDEPDVRAAAGHLARRGAPDSRRGAGDGHDLALERHGRGCTQPSRPANAKAGPRRAPLALRPCLSAGPSSGPGRPSGTAARPRASSPSAWAPGARRARTSRWGWPRVASVMTSTVSSSAVSLPSPQVMWSTSPSRVRKVSSPGPPSRASPLWSTSPLGPGWTSLRASAHRVSLPLPP